MDGKRRNISKAKQQQKQIQPKQVSNQEAGNPERETPPTEAIVVINARLDAMERQQRQDEEEERRHNLSQLRVNKTIAIFTGLLFVTSVVSDIFLLRQSSIGRDSADAAKSAAKTASESLLLQNRPWVKIRHRISSPLTFAIDAARMKLRDTLENVGPTVAVNVLTWEDMIPVDRDQSYATAFRRQREWCDANRHPNPVGLSGYTLFPHDPFEQESNVGSTKETIDRAIRESETVGKIRFVIVGCVCYKAPFEPRSAPTHQTRFVYELGTVKNEQLILSFILPKGIALICA
jgi:hypothetical protein